MSAMTADAGEVAQRSFREVWVITLGHALTHWYPATFYLLLPLIGNELGLSYAQIGSILTCQSAAGAIANVPGGMLVDTVGRKGLLMAISLFWIGIPYLLMGFTHGYWMLLACAALVGIGNNLWHPTAIPLAGRAASRSARAGGVDPRHGRQCRRRAGAARGRRAARRVQLAQRRGDQRDARHRDVAADPALCRPPPDGRSGAGTPAKPHAISGAERLRSLRAAAEEPRLVTLSVGSAFRSMTQSALLTFLPLFLAREMGYPPLWIGACMFALAGRGLHRGADRRASVRHDGPAPDHHVQHGDDRGGDLLAMIFAGGTGFRAFGRVARLLSVRDPRRAAGLAARRDAAAAWAAPPSASCSARRPWLRPSARLRRLSPTTSA